MEGVETLLLESDHFSYYCYIFTLHDGPGKILVIHFLQDNSAVQRCSEPRVVNLSLEIRL